MKKVDVIIPIYGDATATKNCVLSVLKYQTDNERVILINDCSPDKEITDFLDSLKYNEKIVLISHKRNLGFVATVNEGIVTSKDNDVVLLNSDTIVTSNWVKKLKATAYSDELIGTVTPFSNSANILFSYPKNNRGCGIIDNLEPEAINKYFESVARKEVTNLPTGSGFCLYIKRKVINSVGLFDVEKFGRGYGEENDYCMRATYAGYKNVECSSTFIYHKDAGSFGENKKKLAEAGYNQVIKLHPHYTLVMQQYIDNNPYLDLFRKVDICRYSQNQKPGFLMVLHGRGGGTEKHVMEFSEEIIKRGNRVFCIRPRGGGVSLENLDPAEAFNLVFEGDGWYEKLLTIMRVINISHVHFQHLLGLPSEIFRINEDLGVPRDFTIHDFYIFCPRVHATNSFNNTYCMEKGSQGCQKCLRILNNTKYLKENESFLKGCRKIFAPTDFVAELVKKHFKSVKICVVPHFEKNTRASLAVSFKEPTLAKQSINVGIVGSVSLTKGGPLFEDCVRKTDENKLPISWYLFGEHYESSYCGRSLHVTGKYKGYDHLKEYLAENKIDIIFIPWEWPETYSYILSECWLLGIPVIAFNIGAFGERISKVGGGWLLPRGSEASTVCDLILKIKENPSEINEKRSNILSNFKPGYDFPWQQYYGKLKFPSQIKIKPADLKKAVELISSLGMVSDAKRMEEKEEIGRLRDWIVKLERDTIKLRETIQGIRKRRIYRLYRVYKKYLKRD